MKTVRRRRNPSSFSPEKDRPAVVPGVQGRGGEERPGDREEEVVSQGQIVCE